MGARMRMGMGMGMGVVPGHLACCGVQRKGWGRLLQLGIVNSAGRRWIYKPLFLAMASYFGLSLGVLSFSLVGWSHDEPPRAPQSNVSMDERHCSRDLASGPQSDYVKNASIYMEKNDRVSESVSQQRENFVRLLPEVEKKIIASVGEGFGRDVAFFRKQGLRAVGTDGSAEMVRLAGPYLGTSTDFVQLLAQDFSLEALGLGPEEKLAGIWAMASLHHVPTEELGDVFSRFARALVPGGVVHASFVMGVGTPDVAEVAIDRFWSRITRETLLKVIRSEGSFEIMDETGAVRNDYFLTTPSAGFHFFNLWLRRR